MILLSEALPSGTLLNANANGMTCCLYAKMQGVTFASSQSSDCAPFTEVLCVAAARGSVDDVIDPRETRPRLINALDMLQNKRDENPTRKHGNIPL